MSNSVQHFYGVSVIVPVYNAADKLHSCLDSILGQSYSDLEVILVDDGSKDESPSICDSYAKKDSRVKVLHTENRGVGSARNSGLSMATNEWVSFIDSDDWIDSDYYGNMMRNTAREDCDLVIQGYVKQNSEGIIGERLLLEHTYGQSEIDRCFLENDLLNFGSPCCKLFRSSLIREHGIHFPEGYSYEEDTVFFLRYSSFCRSIACLSAQGYHYIEYSIHTLSHKVHSTYALISFVKDSQQGVSFFSAYSSGDELIRLQNIKNVALSNRAYLNMYKLGYGRDEKLSCVEYFHGKVRNLLSFTGVSFRDKCFLILTGLPSRIQLFIMDMLNSLGIIRA